MYVTQTVVKRHTLQTHVCLVLIQEFMESEGMVVNDPEPMPEDPYIKHRQQPPSHYTTPPESNPSRQFLTMDRKVKETGSVPKGHTRATLPY